MGDLAIAPRHRDLALIGVPADIGVMQHILTREIMILNGYTRIMIKQLKHSGLNESDILFGFTGETMMYRKFAENVVGFGRQLIKQAYHHNLR